MAQAGLQQPGGQSSIAAPSLLLPGDARGVGFTPASLPGLVLWLDAAGIGQADNTSVSRWPDQSGKGNHATQGTVAAQPTYLAAGIAGHPALSFDGVDDWFSIPSMAPATVLVVGTATADSMVLATPTLTPNCQVRIDRSGAGSLSVYDFHNERLSSSISTAAPSLVEFLIDTAAGASFLQNGAFVGTNVGSVVAFSVSTVGQLAMSAGTFYAGLIGSLLVYSRVLTPADRHAVEGYLSARYAIPVVQR